MAKCYPVVVVALGLYVWPISSSWEADSCQALSDVLPISYSEHVRVLAH
jgi:hypothetical protein